MCATTRKSSLTCMPGSATSSECAGQTGPVAAGYRRTYSTTSWNCSAAASPRGGKRALPTAGRGLPTGCATCPPDMHSLVDNNVKNHRAVPSPHTGAAPWPWAIRHAGTRSRAVHAADAASMWYESRNSDAVRCRSVVQPVSEAILALLSDVADLWVENLGLEERIGSLYSTKRSIQSKSSTLGVHNAAYERYPIAVRGRQADELTIALMADNTSRNFRLVCAVYRAGVATWAGALPWVGLLESRGRQRCLVGC